MIGIHWVKDSFTESNTEGVLGDCIVWNEDERVVLWGCVACHTWMRRAFRN